MNNLSGVRLDKINSVDKVSSGVAGLDEVLYGGLPKGRPTLICGGTGCGKTLLATEFLCRGILDDKAGVLISFEENASELAENMGSLGFDLPRMQAEGKLAIDHVSLTPEMTIEAGSYDLEGLLIRIAHSVDSVKAERVVIDGIETLFGALEDPGVVRSELIRLFSWTKDRGLTVIVTAERGENGMISRHGVEEYVSDCVIVLDNRIDEQQSTRRLRVVKYRGSMHGTDEYPFLITDTGFVIVPITSLGLQQIASNEKISTGITRLDELLSGGVFRGTSILVSGSAGTGKTSFGANFADAACRRGERTLYVSYEESCSQLVRNMRSIGVDFDRWIEGGILRVESVRPTFYGLEAHLTWISHLLNEFDPTSIVVDPLNSVVQMGTPQQVSSMMTREIDLLKSRGVTALFTALARQTQVDTNHLQVSSLIDTWLDLKNVESNGERNRLLTIVKSRGMAHSNQLIEYSLSSSGINLIEPYVGPAGVLTGSARSAQEELDQIHESNIVSSQEERIRKIEQRKKEFEFRIAAMRTEFEFELAQLSQEQIDEGAGQNASRRQRFVMGDRRWATPPPQEPASDSE